MGSKHRGVAPAQRAAPRRYGELGMAVAGLLSAIALIRMFSLFSQLPSRATQVDYSVYYLSGYLLLQGANPYTADLNRLATLFDMDTLGIPRATDPPTFLAMFEPLAMLGPRESYWTWQALNALALAVSLWMLLGRGSGIRPDVGIALAALAVMYPAVLNHFYYGQNKVQVLLLLVITMQLLESRRDAAAGLVLALAGLMRIFPLLLLGYLLIRRRWRAIAFTGIGLVGGLLATGVVIGFPVELSCLKGIDVLTGTQWLHYNTNIALGSFVSRLYWAWFGVDPGAGIETLRHATIVVAWLGMLGLACLATLRSAAAEDRDSRVFGLWVATGIALSPTAWIHYMVLLFIPFARISSAAGRGDADRRTIGWAIASYALLAAGCPWGCVDVSGELFYMLASSAGIHIEGIIVQTATVSLLLGWAAAFVFAMSGDVSEARSIRASASISAQVDVPQTKQRRRKR